MTPSRFNQTSSVLSKIVGNSSLLGIHNMTNNGSVAGGGFDRQYGQNTPVRSAYSSDLRRIANLGPLPAKPDLSKYYTDRGDDRSDDDSGDSPDEDPIHRRGHPQKEQDDEEELPPVKFSSTHRNDGVLAPKLTRPRYYTVPSEDVLKRMSERELATVRDFTVGHEDYGQVKWEGLTDVRALDLDKIVQFEHGKVEVYDDTLDDKPKEGELLNKYAIIQLHDIWSAQVREAEEQTTVLSEESRAKYQSEWGAVLQKHCANTGTKFRGYDTKKGDWTFGVEHFTIYSMPGSKPKPKATKPGKATLRKAGLRPMPSTLFPAHSHSHSHSSTTHMVPTPIPKAVAATRLKNAEQPHPEPHPQPQPQPHHEPQ